MSEAAITIGNHIPVGNVIVDPRAIKGVGSWYNPYPYIPIKIQMYGRKEGEYITLIRLTASLHLTETIDINNQFGDRVSYDLLFNMSHRSTVATKPAEGDVQLLFSLTHEQIKQLDNIRRTPGSNLFLRLEPVVVRLSQTEQAVLTLGEQRTNIGNLSDFAYPWLADIRILRIETAEMKWTESIFPAIGYDHYRLVEVGLPSSDVLVPKEAIEYFQKAKKYYDVGNNTECLRECRLALEEIEKRLKVQSHELGTAITKQLGWPNQPQLTEQAQFLNRTWFGLYMLTNAASHTPSTKSLLPADAHTGFLLIAVMLEYLGQLE